LQQIYLGPASDSDETWKALNSSGVSFKDYRGNTPGLLEHVVDRLVEGK
jgi:hypothetical protein